MYIRIVTGYTGRFLTSHIVHILHRNVHGAVQARSVHGRRLTASTLDLHARPFAFCASNPNKQHAALPAERAVGLRRPPGGPWAQPYRMRGPAEHTTDNTRHIHTSKQLSPLTRCAFF